MASLRRVIRPVVFCTLLIAVAEDLSASDGIIPHGLARPIRQVNVSPRTPGVLTDLFVSAGDTVEKDTVLGVIDNQVAQATVQAARAAAERTAEIEQSRRALEFARRHFERYRSVANDDAIAAIELDNAAAQVADAEAVLESALEKKLQAERNLQLEQARLERHNIRAPFTGQVIKVLAQRGAALPQQEALLTLVDSRQLEVELYLHPDIVRRLHVGKTYSLRAMTPVNGTVQGTLTFISPVIESGTKTFRTVFLIDNDRAQLPAGFSVAFGDAEALENTTRPDSSP